MKIYTLIIDHRHGTNVYNFLSEAEMNAALYAYVKETWYEEDGNIATLSHDEAIDRFFHQNLWSEDWYKTEETEFELLADLVTALRNTQSAALELARERDPDQLGLWDAVFTPAKLVLSTVDKLAAQ